MLLLFVGRRRRKKKEGGRLLMPIFNETVQGVDNGQGYGVRGDSVRGGDGVFGNGKTGVRGFTETGSGVFGEADSTGIGVSGFSPNGIAVYGESKTAPGVVGVSETDAVKGNSNNGLGVDGYSNTNYGVAATSKTNYGLYAGSEAGLAAYLSGNVEITGNLSVGGILKSGGAFRIDHPLDPANKYLSHSFVESPDMKNVYDGVVVLDDKGEAVIELPDWFGALNKDFRYQLTAIGAPAPNLYISEEISISVIIGYGSNTSSSNGGCNNNRFKIAGGTPGMKVSWQVTGIRKDPWANANRISVEEDKPAKERGYYTYPELYGQPKERGISHLLVPQIEKEPLLINK
jgi:hypothetical protein